MIPSFGNFMGLHGWFLHVLVKGIIVGIRARIIVIIIYYGIIISCACIQVTKS